MFSKEVMHTKSQEQRLQLVHGLTSGTRKPSAVPLDLKSAFFFLEIKERHFLFGLECSRKKRKCLHLRRAVIAQDTQHMHLRYTSWTIIYSRGHKELRFQSKQEPKI